MRVREAKDFLVQQTVEQASLESIPFSDLEKRVMYFTESGEMSEDPFELKDAFEAEYDATVYAANVSTLMAHAYARLKKEDSSLARIWNEAIQELHKRDHSLFVLWGHPNPRLSANHQEFLEVVW
jgi:hypothetical protein